MFRDFLTELGLKAPDLMAGMAGGVVNAIVYKRSTPIAYVGSIIVGALTANYLGEPAANYFGLKQVTAGFVIGLGGVVLCQTIVAIIPAIVERWSNTGGRNAS